MLFVRLFCGSRSCHEIRADRCNCCLVFYVYIYILSKTRQRQRRRGGKKEEVIKTIWEEEESECERKRRLRIFIPTHLLTYFYTIRGKERVSDSFLICVGFSFLFSNVSIRYILQWQLVRALCQRLWRNQPLVDLP